MQPKQSSEPLNNVIECAVKPMVCQLVKLGLLEIAACLWRSTPACLTCPSTRMQWSKCSNTAGRN